MNSDIIDFIKFLEKNGFTIKITEFCSNDNVHFTIINSKTDKSSKANILLGNGNYIIHIVPCNCCILLLSQSCFYIYEHDGILDFLHNYLD